LELIFWILWGCAAFCAKAFVPLNSPKAPEAAPNPTPFTSERLLINDFSLR
jgi:hypothetical protein